MSLPSRASPRTEEGNLSVTDRLVIRGAREHNLKNVHLDLPRNALIVFTGLSGSGKSSLAFDTIYAEGQRRYVESLSAYARQFLGLMEKPDVDFIEGLSPAISIDQKSTSKNPRSTVGTITEVYDYLRLLYARIGQPHCPRCGRPISRQTPDQIVDRILELPAGTRLTLITLVRRVIAACRPNSPGPVAPNGSTPYNAIPIRQRSKRVRGADSAAAELARCRTCGLTPCRSATRSRCRTSRKARRC